MFICFPGIKVVCLKVSKLVEANQAVFPVLGAFEATLGR